MNRHSLSFSDPQLDLGGEELDHHLPAAHRLHHALHEGRQHAQGREGGLGREVGRPVKAKFRTESPDDFKSVRNRVKLDDL